MAARTALLFCACVIFAITVPAVSICPDGCFCVAFETDCSGLGLTDYPSESEIYENTEYLRLGHNNLENVPRIDLQELERYNLEWNKIINIEWDAFLGVPNLNSLNLSHNLISDVQQGEFQSLYELEYLDLSYNKLTEIGELVFNGMSLKKLEELDLSHNEIETIDKDSFTGLKSLKSLWLNNNQLKSIQHHPFNGVENLWYLYLHSNKLQTIEDKSFYPMERLVTLTLNKNVLKSVQKMALYNLKGVENLDLSDNQLTEVPVEAMDDLLSLTTLNFGGNPIKKLAKSDFPHTHNQLVKLALSNMPNLHNIEDSTFDNLPNLENVNISNNPKLTSLPSTLFFKSFHKLRNVDLSHNSLSELDREMLPWDKLFTLSVTGNKWRCDCTCRWMKNYTFEMDLQCASPKHLAGRMMDDIPEYEFFCADPKDTRGGDQRALRVCLAAGAITLSLFIIGAVLFKMRKRLPCFKGAIKYISLYNIYDPHNDNSGIVVTFRGDKVETKSAGVDLEKDML